MADIVPPTTCYLCDWGNPNADPEACESCEREYFAYVMERQRRLEAVTDHRRESTDAGPDFCRDCSEAITDWVPWPCGGAA